MPPISKLHQPKTMAIIKVLTLQQPWAWAIFHAGKDIENRRWFTNYRGILYIHAGKSYNRGAEAWIKWKFDIDIPPKSEMEFGKIIGAVKLNGIGTQLHQSNAWALPDKYHWQLENPILLPSPIPAIGRLSLWKMEI